MATVTKMRPKATTVPNVYLQRRHEPKYHAMINISTTDAWLHFGPPGRREVAQPLEAARFRGTSGCAVQAITLIDQRGLKKQPDRNKVIFATTEAVEAFLEQCYDLAEAHPSWSDRDCFFTALKECFGEAPRSVGPQDPQERVKTALLNGLQRDFGVDIESLKKREGDALTVERLRYLRHHPQDVYSGEHRQVIAPRDGALREIIKPQEMADRQEMIDARVEYGRMCEKVDRDPEVPSFWSLEKLKAETLILKGVVDAALSPKAPGKVTAPRARRVPSAYDNATPVDHSSPGATEPPGSLITAVDEDDDDDGDEG